MAVADTNPEYWQEYGPFQKVKHDLIKSYLGGWFPKLGTWAGRVLYVDTHAGRGRHSSGETASCLIASVELLANGIGARWSTYIRMTSGGTATRYLLLHLTNHDEGRDLMKECMWKVAPDGGFEVLQQNDPRQPLLITPSPNLEPLREWLLERLERRPHKRDELYRELRSTPWLPSHPRKLARQLRKEGNLDFDAASDHRMRIHDRSSVMRTLALPPVKHQR